MANLPQRLTLVQTQQQWASQINPVLANPIANASILPGLNLTAGVNIISHKLGQLQQGWFIVDQQGPASIYRSAAFNNLTLQLTCSAAVTIDLAVF